jgi:hypothetical protein
MKKDREWMQILVPGVIAVALILGAILLTPSQVLAYEDFWSNPQLTVSESTSGAVDYSFTADRPTLLKEFHFVRAISNTPNLAVSVNYGTYCAKSVTLYSGTFSGYSYDWYSIAPEGLYIPTGGSLQFVHPDAGSASILTVTQKLR